MVKKRDKPKLSKEEREATREVEMRRREDEAREDALENPRSTDSASKKKKTSKPKEEREAKRKRGEDGPESEGQAEGGEDEGPESEGEAEGGEDALENPRSTASASKKKKTTSEQKETEQTPAPAPGSAAFKAARKRRKRLEKRAAVRKPRERTDEAKIMVDGLKEGEPIFALWDYENLPRPTVGAFGMIERKLKNEGYTGALTLNAVVGYVGDPQPEDVRDPHPEEEDPEEEEEKFRMHYGDPVNTRPAGTFGNQIADDCIEGLFKAFHEQNPPPQNVLLISNDNGFTPWLADLRDAQHRVVVATSQDCHELKTEADEMWDWDKEVLPFL